MNRLKRAKFFWACLVIAFFYAVAVTVLWFGGLLSGLRTAVLVGVVVGAYAPLAAILTLWAIVRSRYKHEDHSTQKLRKTLDSEQLQSEAVLTSLDEGVLIMGKDGVIKYMNPRMAEMMASTDEVMVGKHFSRLMNDEVSIVSSSTKKPRLSHNVVQVLGSGVPMQIERERLLYKSTNTFLDLSISILPLKNENGEVSALMITGRDISTLTVTQDKENEFLVKASSRVGNLLQPVRTQMDEISSTNQLDEQTSQKFQRVQTSLAHLEQLVSDMQMYISLSLSTSKQETKFVDTAEVFAKAAERATTHHTGKYVKVTPDIAVSSIITDEKQFQLVVDQLVDNAYKFSPDEDTVLVRAVADGSTAVVEIVDNGVGMTDKDRAMIFEPFAKEYDPKHQDSTGLGISICKKIVDGWGGEIKVSVQEVGGVIISFTIPHAIPGTGDDSDETLAVGIEQ